MRKFEASELITKSLEGDDCETFKECFEVLRPKNGNLDKDGKNFFLKTWEKIFSYKAIEIMEFFASEFYDEIKDAECLENNLISAIMKEKNSTVVNVLLNKFPDIERRRAMWYIFNSGGKVEFAKLLMENLSENKMAELLFIAACGEDFSIGSAYEFVESFNYIQWSRDNALMRWVYREKPEKARLMIKLGAKLSKTPEVIGDCLNHGMFEVVDEFCEISYLNKPEVNGIVLEKLAALYRVLISLIPVPHDGHDYGYLCGACFTEYFKYVKKWFSSGLKSPKEYKHYLWKALFRHGISIFKVLFYYIRHNIWFDFVLFNSNCKEKKEK